MAPKCKSTLSWNPFHSEVSSSSEPTPSHVWFHDDKAKLDFFENFSRQGIHSERQVILSDFSDIGLPTIIYSREWESLCNIPITCPSMLIQEFYSNIHRFDYLVSLFVTRIRGSRIVVTSDIISDVLRVPKVEHPDYSGYDRLKAVSKEELISSFCERTFDWGDRHFTPYSAFAKGLRFMNMVMTFVLHPLSHYNSITEPRARFLLYLLKHLTVDFPSYFILSIIDVFRDTTTHEKLIFPSAITCSFSLF